MARIWCCSARVTLAQPLNVPGYPNSKNIIVDTKVRVEEEGEPSSLAITESVRNKIKACYTCQIEKIYDPSVDFILWEL
jgi:hypothetical protein